MTMNEIISTIATACPGATMCRRSNVNFLAVPGDVVDGVQTYYAVKVSTLLAKDTKVKPVAPVAAAVAAAPEIAKPAAPGTAGELKLHDVEPKTAAMLMAIVADKMGKPLNELRFISIKEVK